MNGTLHNIQINSSFSLRSKKFQACSCGSYDRVALEKALVLSSPCLSSYSIHANYHSSKHLRETALSRASNNYERLATKGDQGRNLDRASLKSRIPFTARAGEENFCRLLLCVCGSRGNPALTFYATAQIKLAIDTLCVHTQSDEGEKKGGHREQRESTATHIDSNDEKQKKKK